VIRRTIVTALLLASTHTALADDDEPSTSTLTATATATAPHDPPLRRFYFRAGVARVIPLSQSRELQLADVNGPASLALSDGPVAGSGSSVDSATALAAVLGWKLGKTGRWSLETLIGAPFTVKFRATGSLANMSLAPTALGLPTGVQPLGPDLGEAKAAPPMLTLVYQLRPDHRFRPFVGAGASVLIAYDAKVTNATLTAVSQPSFNVSPAPGLVLQTGAEVSITNRIYARLDIKFIAGMLAHADVTNIKVATPDIPLFGAVDVGTAKMSVWVNPLVVQAAIGTDF
jgi:outer membrane protein W